MTPQLDQRVASAVVPPCPKIKVADDEVTELVEPPSAGSKRPGTFIHEFEGVDLGVPTNEAYEPAELAATPTGNIAY